jgi:hypothetical protein
MTGLTTSSAASMNLGVSMPGAHSEALGHGGERLDRGVARAAGVGRDPRLLGENLGRLAVRHHQEPDRFQPKLPGQAEMLDGDVRPGAAGGDPADRRAEPPGRRTRSGC